MDMAEARAERRLAAIVIADIVGYSRLIEIDESGTLGAVKALRTAAIDPLVSEYRGRIVKLMGDGMVIEFASVVDATACAIAIQKAVAARQSDVPAERRIILRIGINLATSSLMMATCSATASMSRPGWSSFVLRAACWFRGPHTIR